MSKLIVNEYGGIVNTPRRDFFQIFSDIADFDKLVLTYHVKPKIRKLSHNYFYRDFSVVLQSGRLLNVMQVQHYLHMVYASLEIVDDRIMLVDFEETVQILKLDISKVFRQNVVEWG
jgi:hypothetical protein